MSMFKKIVLSPTLALFFGIICYGSYKIYLKKNKNKELCIICFDKIVDTMVLPCEHSFVCKHCCIALKKTNDAKICVYCRVRFTSIINLDMNKDNLGFKDFITITAGLTGILGVYAVHKLINKKNNFLC